MSQVANGSGSDVPRKFQVGDPIDKILDLNKNWSQKTWKTNPEVFEKLAGTQKPQVLWISCSDSRCPETTLTDTFPGELFVHRNIANTVLPHDASVASVLQLAVEALKVKHIVVAGHYDCAGVKAAFHGQNFESPLGDWLQGIRQVYLDNKSKVEAADGPAQQNRKLVDLNVAKQVENVAANHHVVNQRKERQVLIHGFSYDVGNGLLTSVCCNEA